VISPLKKPQIQPTIKLEPFLSRLATRAINAAATIGTAATVCQTSAHTLKTAIGK
jgi:hypothetical protein